MHLVAGVIAFFALLAIAAAQWALDERALRLRRSSFVA